MIKNILKYIFFIAIIFTIIYIVTMVISPSFKYANASNFGEIPGRSTMKAYWKMNGNSTDSSGNSINGTDNSIFYGNQYGKFGQGVLFAGANSRITFGSSTQIFGGSNKATISVWVYPTSTTAENFIDNRDGAGCNSWQGYVNGINVGSMYFSYWVNTTETFAISAAGSVPANKWSYVTSVYDGSNIQVYVNGVKSGSPVAMTGNIDSETGCTLALGGLTFGEYDGYLDEIILERRVWSPEEIQKYYTQTRGMFRSRMN